MSQHTDAAGFADGDGQDDAAELIPRLRIIEQQPLAERAGAYAAVHDELARHLESGPTG